MNRKVRALWWPLTVNVTCPWCFMEMGEWTLAEVKGLGTRAVRCESCGNSSVLPPDLLAHAKDVQAEHDPDDPPGRGEAYDAIVGNVVLRRAIVIALTGYHTLTVVGRADDNWPQVQTILGDRAMLMQLCPCGHLNSKRRVCDCTTTQIEAHRKTKAFQGAALSDIIVETYTPRAEEFWADNNEPWTSVLARIQQARFLKSFGWWPVLWPTNREGQPLVRQNQVTFDVLNQASKRLSWGTEQIRKVQRVAQTIAALDGADLVAPTHMAEAVLYRVPLADE